VKTVAKVVMALSAVLPLGVATGAVPAYAATGIHVSGQAVLEGNGRSFMMRGTSKPHAWYPGNTANALGWQKGWHANTVRVVLSGGRWSKNSASDVANVIATCKSNKLICLLEDHDTTGYGEAGGAYSLSSAADYWISIKSALQGQESYVVINIGNEPYGNRRVGRSPAQRHLLRAHVLAVWQRVDHHLVPECL
jgi:mannan endo-1,4-beta-mannosidase